MKDIVTQTKTGNKRTLIVDSNVTSQMQKDLKDTEEYLKSKEFVNYCKDHNAKYGTHIDPSQVRVKAVIPYTMFPYVNAAILNTEGDKLGSLNRSLSGRESPLAEYLSSNTGRLLVGDDIGNRMNPSAKEVSIFDGGRKSNKIAGLTT